MGVPKLKFLLFRNLDIHIFFKSKFVWNMERQYLIAFKKINHILHAPIGDHLIHALKGFVVGNQILNLTFNLSFDHNSCISSLNE